MLSVAGLTMVALPSGSLFAQERASETLGAVSEVFENFRGVALKDVPPALLHDAQGVAIIPRAGKTGFVLTAARMGQGVVLLRNTKGVWMDPILIAMVGGKAGWSSESSDFIVIFKTRKGVEYFLDKGKVVLGKNVTIAAGPVIRPGEAGPELRADSYSYARSQGAFAGLALESVALRRNGADASFKKDNQQVIERLKAELTAICGQPAAPTGGRPGFATGR
jgi:lipid-binding SYLF domain-containing protein